MKRYISWLLLLVLGLVTMFLVWHQLGWRKASRQMKVEIQELQQNLAWRDAFLHFDDRLLADELSTATAKQLLHAALDSLADSTALASVKLRLAYLNQLEMPDRQQQELLNKQKNALEALQQTYQALEEEAFQQRKHSQQSMDSLQRLLLTAEGNLARTTKELQLKNRVKVISFATALGATVHYLGEVVDGQANGGGIGIWTTGSIYRGVWRNNQRHGQGSFTWKDGERYEGTYVNGKREGEGTYYWPSGERYEGQWLADQRNGQGTLFDLDGNIRFKGEWLNDAPATTK